MTLPAGVDTRTVRLTMPLDGLGKPPRSYEGTVTVDRALVWEETGARLWPAGAALPNVVGAAIRIPVPRVDQDGWVDGNGNAITGFSFTVRVTALWRTGEATTVERVFQVVEDTPDEVELELLPDGATEPVVIGPAPGGGGVDPADLAAETAARIAADNALTTAVAARATTAALNGETADREAADDAHTAALTAGLATKAPTVHTHAVGDVTGLTAALAGKATAAQGALADTAVQPAALDAALDALVNGAPGMLDTLGEIATALEDADDTIATMLATLAGKASTADLTTETNARVAADALLDGRIDALEAVDVETVAGAQDKADEALADALAAVDDLGDEFTDLLDAEILERSTQDTVMNDRIAAVETDYLSSASPLDASKLIGTINDNRIPAGITRDAEMTAAIAAAIANLIASAPGALDTLDELAAAIGDDANFAATITNALALKAPLASPALTGNPTAPTPATGDNDTSIATTAFTQTTVNARTPQVLVLAVGAPVPGGTAAGTIIVRY